MADQRYGEGIDCGHPKCVALVSLAKRRSAARADVQNTSVCSRRFTLRSQVAHRLGLFDTFPLYPRGDIPPRRSAIQYLATFLLKSRIKHLSGLTLEWISKHSDEFRIHPASDDALLWQVKHLIELMTMLTTLSNHGIRSKTISSLTGSGLTYGAEFDWHQLATYDASAATAVAMVAEFFSINHRPPPFERQFIQFLHLVGFFEGMDRIPFREMDLVYSLGVMISPEFRKELPVWFQSTAFGQRQCLTRYTVDDLYSLTHAVFYLTSFGQSELSELLSTETTERLRQELVALTVILLRADNMDVLAELLLCWLFCRVEVTPLNKIIFHQAMERLLCATTADGQVVPKMEALPRAQAGQTHFDDVYHTTLVGCMLFSLTAKDLPYVH